MPQSPQITNPKLVGHTFLKHMADDSYFPTHLVEKGVAILAELCGAIEETEPADLDALYTLTHAATERFNELDEEFAAAGSEIETVAREIIAEDFAVIAEAYGFTDADIEELIAPRDW